MNGGMEALDFNKVQSFCLFSHANIVLESGKDSNSVFLYLRETLTSYVCRHERADEALT